MVEAVNQIEKPEDSGFTAVAQSRARGGYLGVSEDFKVRLIVPAGRDLEKRKNLINERAFPPRKKIQYFEFLEQLNEAEILKSAFSRQEVVVMADHLIGYNQGEVYRRG